jgi:hypothetical protein
MLVISLSASHVSSGVDTAKKQQGSSAGGGGGQQGDVSNAGSAEDPTCTSIK